MYNIKVVSVEGGIFNWQIILPHHGFNDCENLFIIRYSHKETVQIFSICLY